MKDKVIVIGLGELSASMQALVLKTLQDEAVFVEEAIAKKLLGVIQKYDPIEANIALPVVEHKKLSEHELEELRAQHGEIYALKAMGKKDTAQHVHYAYLKMVSIDVFATVMAQMDTNPIVAIKTLLINAFVAGDANVKTNLRLFTSIMKPIQKLINSQEGEFGEA